MSYQQATFLVSETMAEIFSEALMNHGALSTTVEDADAGTDNEQAIFGEPDMPQQFWQNSRLVALFAQDSDVARCLTQAANEAQIEIPTYEISVIEDQDWVRQTQAQFDPIQISKRLWITPTWHETPDKNAINLRLDPGLAFGTGSHPTTHLCLQWLDCNLHGGETVLDYGCGSGILAIAALKLGAHSATGVDIDPQAIIASHANAEQNHVNAQFFLPDDLPDGQFDVVVANILTNPLRMLGSMLAARTRPGGTIVLSGILAEQAQELCEVYAQWFTLKTPQFNEGWVCISGIKNN